MWDWLARLGGADPEVLKQVEHPEAERNHFARLGATLFVPFALGAAGMTIVGHVVTHRPAVDIQLVALGAGWGALVAFVIDALLIRSTLDLRDRRRYGSRATMLILRFGLSIAAAFAITEPLLTIIFSDAVAKTELAARIERFDELEATARRKEFDDAQGKLRTANTEARTRLDNEFNAAQTTNDRNSGSCEREASGRNGGDEGFGPQATRLCALETARLTSLDTARVKHREASETLHAQLSGLETAKQNFEGKLATERNAIENTPSRQLLDSLGVFERVEAMHETVDWWLIAVLAFLFLSADVLPVVYKQAAPPTEHDIILARRRASAWADHGFAVELRQIEHQTNLDVDTARGAGRVEKEKVQATTEVTLATQDGEARIAMAKAEADAAVADHAEWLAERAQRQTTAGSPSEGEPPGTTPDSTDVDAGAAPAAPVGVPGPPARSPADFPTAGSIYVRDVAVLLDNESYIGGQGVVRAGRLVTPLRDHDWADESVAVKVPHPNAPSLEAGRMEIQNYRQLAARIGLSLPRWVVADGESRTFPRLVFEHFPRASLDRWLFGTGRVPFEVEAWTLLAWLEFVVDIHEPLWHSGLCNPDAKLENYLVAGRRPDDPIDPDPPLGFAHFTQAQTSLDARLPGRLVLCDLSSICKTLARAAEYTPGHSPPEWGGRRGPATFAGNIYSALGVAGFRLATAGRFPNPLKSRRQRRPATYNKLVPPALDRMIADFLEPDPIVRLAKIGLDPSSSGTQVTQHLHNRIQQAYEALCANDHEYAVVLASGTTPVKP